MELGTGILLSAIFLGSVALFIATKDRWKWKKILLWPLGIIVGLSVIGGTIGYAYKQYEGRPKVVTEFKGIQLGEKFQDVIFKRGKAERMVSRDVERLTRYIVEIKNEKGTPKFEEISVAYKNAKDAEAKEIANGSDGDYFLNDIYLVIKNNQVETISHECNTESSDYTSVNDVSCGSTGDEILAKFGDNIRVLCAIGKKHGEEQSLNRVYDAVKYGTRYFLNKNKVIAIGVASPSRLDSYVGINWGKCS